MKLKIYTGEELRAHRARLGLNQTDFWSHFGITQSGGCRYEAGRSIPEPVQILLRIALATDAKAAAIVVSLRAHTGKTKKPPASAKSK